MLDGDTPQPALKDWCRVPKAGKSLETLGRAWHNGTGTLGAWRGRVSSLRASPGLTSSCLKEKINACECKREGRREKRDPKWEEEDGDHHPSALWLIPVDRDGQLQ